MKKLHAPSRQTVKLVARTVVGISVKGVVATAVAHNVPVESKVDKAKLFVATFAIGGMVAEASKNHISGQVDGVYDAVTEIKKQIAEFQGAPPQQ